MRLIQPKYIALTALCSSCSLISGFFGEHCGNNLKEEPDELCDDGNLTDGDDCDSNCTLTACGNGIITAGEICDDQNLTDGDGCDRDCTPTSCGNKIITGDERCDDGNLTDGDGCDSNCTLTSCGNGVLTSGEACDDGNALDEDGCSAGCAIERCGDGISQPDLGEECDNGESNQLAATALTTQSCNTQEHSSLTFVSEGGLVLSSGKAFYTGFDTGVFDLDSLLGTSLSQELTAPIYNLETGEVFVFGQGGSPFFGSFFFFDVADSLLAVDGQSGQLTGQVLPLSRPIFFEFDNSLFSGAGRSIVVAGSELFDINLTTGEVTGPGLIFINPNRCDNLGAWGFAETFDNDTTLVYAQGNNIVRTFLSNQQTDVLASFSDLGGMCDLAAAPLNDRWYFHIQGPSQLTSGQENIGYCDAAYQLGVSPAGGDGCSAQCKIESCGDGIVQGPRGEQCDDANNNTGDGCDQCQVEVGFDCDGSPSVCQPICHDGLVIGGEECDDTDLVNTNACKNDCTASVCGDGVVAFFEQCDDGNTVNGDGCDASCRVDIVPASCGNAIIEPGEQCDDGNTVNGDGCDANCFFPCGASISPSGAALEPISGSCYAWFSTQIDWQSSVNDCFARGSNVHLALIESGEENTTARSASNIAADPWIGYNDISTEAATNAANFVNIFGQPIGNGFNGFGAGQPSNSAAAQDCVRYIANADTWDDANCTVVRSYICEIER